VRGKLQTGIGGPLQLLHLAELTASRVSSREFRTIRRFEVKCASMLVRIPVVAAKDVSAAALDRGETHFLLALPAAVLVLLY